jgi:anti-sigma regulatory factor (Ser/Thr protein kinase)
VLQRDGTLPARVRDDVILLVSELVTNAVRHAGAGPERPLRMQLSGASHWVRVAVADQGPGFAGHLEPPPGTESGGWGLFLVDQIADRWGVEPTSSGSRVWFEIQYEG